MRGALMREVEVRESVRQYVAELVGKDPAAIEPSMTLMGNLAFDSLQLYELAARLEDELGIPTLPESDVASIETVGDVEGCVVALLARDGAAATADSGAASREPV
jgi:acyl carrier protein